MTTTKYQIDTTHSHIEFAIRHLMFSKVRGKFTGFTGTVELDDQDITRSKVTAEIQAASINTNEDKRDAHLRSADFFDVEQFPLITFTGSSIEKKGAAFRLKGALSMHGITKDIELEVEALGTAKDPWGNQRIAFSAKGALDRKEFGLNWNQLLEAGGVLVSDKVELTFDIEAVQETARAVA